MTFNKKIAALLLTGALSVSLIAGAAGCSNNDSAIKDLQDKIDGYSTSLSGYESKIDELTSAVDDYKNQIDELNKLLGEMNDTLNQAETDYVQQCYDKIKYIDENVKDRDCIAGEQFVYAQEYIKSTLTNAGYSEEDIKLQDVAMTRYYKKETNLNEALSAVSKYETDGKFYDRSGRNYVEAEDGAYVKATLYTPNIILTKQGKSDKQIIVGAHYDGDGTGDNGSGISLALTMAERLYSVDVPNTVVFVFFTAEEYGCYGSTAYANAMTDEEVANTLYMINMDSLICGDYCYLYGGVQDDETQTVTQTEAFENAMAVAESLGLEFKNNPWTWENPAPGYDEPDYAFPSTGDWSDHVGFKNKGIPYVYFEATNWEIPGPYEEYDGYGETYLVGMLMNTENDYLEYIETYFPGRPQKHLYQFFTLLNALLVQPNVNL